MHNIPFRLVPSCVIDFVFQLAHSVLAAVTKTCFHFSFFLFFFIVYVEPHFSFIHSSYVGRPLTRELTLSVWESPQPSLWSLSFRRRSGPFLPPQLTRKQKTTKQLGVMQDQSKARKMGRSNGSWWRPQRLVPICFWSVHWCDVDTALLTRQRIRPNSLYTLTYIFTCLYFSKQ